MTELNAQVTDAILQAERLPEGSQERRDAFLRVSQIEEQLAAEHPADTLEGEIARVGAVAAAVAAAQPERALELGTRWLGEGVLCGATREVVESYMRRAREQQSEQHP